jgi:16S rRNA (cytosine967-C5)-methyltransferase
MRHISRARSVAFDILLCVERGGYASDLLLSRTADFDSRDAGLAGEIVLGTLRYQAQLDFLSEFFSGKPCRRLDPEVRIALRMGIFQLRYLNRVPAHAAVTESVELIKRARKRSAAGMVNATLRKVHRDPVPWPDRATELSMPSWLLERWDKQFGPEVSEKIGRAFLARPETYVRISSGKIPEGPVLDPTEVPGCFRLVSGEPAGLRIQDIGAQSIVPLLELRPGQTYLDLCAAPGNKTAQALEYGVWPVACDLHLKRLEPLKALTRDLVVLDAAGPLPFKRKFDKILLDVPCSGTGTLGRNPEIKWRLEPDDLDRFHAIQVKMLRQAIAQLATGGMLVYSTCSLEREENEQVVEGVLGCLPEKTVQRVPGMVPGDGFFAAVIRSF